MRNLIAMAVGVILASCAEDRSPQLRMQPEHRLFDPLPGLRESEPTEPELSPCGSREGDRTPGAIDRTFGCEGGIKAMLDIYDVVEQADGRLLFTGWDHSDKVKICRVTADGVADLSFGASNGCVTFDERGIGVEIGMFDGAILLLAWQSPGFLLFRLDESGRLDATFGHGGIVDVEMERVAHPHAMVVSDQKIVVGGRFDDTGADAFVCQLNSDGTTDASFGSNGLVTFRDAGESRYTSVYRLIRHPAGVIATTGHALHAFGADGEYVATFGDAGVLALPFWGIALAETTGSLVVGGEGRALRLTFDGQVEATSSRISTVGRVVDLGILANGSIIMAGSVANGSEEITYGLGRLASNSEPDGSFGIDGASFYLLATDARGLAALRDGRYLLFGTFGMSSGYVVRVWN